jgi:hypothetical protein
MAISVRDSINDIVKRLKEFLDGTERNLDESLETATVDKRRIEAEERRPDNLQPPAAEE